MSNSHVARATYILEEMRKEKNFWNGREAVARAAGFANYLNNKFFENKRKANNAFKKAQNYYNKVVLEPPHPAGSAKRKSPSPKRASSRKRAKTTK